MRLLIGSAKLFILAEPLTLSWENFMKKLTSEFKIKVNSAIVHKQLCQRSKRTEETYQEYVYAMIGIASQSTIEEEAVVTYIIDGIRDAVKNKAVLFEATTFKQIKERLIVYGRI